MRKQQQERGQWLIFTLGDSYDAPFQGGALKEHLAKGWLRGMQDYRPHAPSYYETVLLPHEGYRCGVSSLPLLLKGRRVGLCLVPVRSLADLVL